MYSGIDGPVTFPVGTVMHAKELVEKYMSDNNITIS
jgi:hypothetical protein